MGEGWEAAEGALTQYLMEEKEGGKRERGGGVVEMEKRADVKSDCMEENKGVKMRGGDRGWRGRGGERERERESRQRIQAKGARTFAL